MQYRLVSWLPAAITAASMWGAGSVAQARELVWSVGVGTPGVHVGVSNAPVHVHRAPVVVVQQPVYVPQPVYRRPPAVYYAPPHVVYAQPQVVYVTSPVYRQPVWVGPGYGHGWGKQKHHKERKFRHWRGDRD